MSERSLCSEVRRASLTALALAACLGAAACSGKPRESAPAAAITNATTASTAQTVIDGMTGKTAVDAGQKAKAQIEKISAKHNADLDETME